MAQPPEVSGPSMKELAELLAKAIGDAVRTNRPQGPLEQAGFTPERIAELTEIPKPHRHRKVACRSTETGATFTACVVESKTFPAGRITAFEDYVHPEGVTRYQRDGGRVPDGMQILRAGTSAPVEGATLAKHDCTPYYLQWRYSEFWRLDLSRYSGKALTRELVVDAAAWSTPWEEGRVGKFEAA